MVLPLLYGLSAKDYMEPRGFLLLTCQKCKATGPFVAFDAKRKVTVYSIPTVAFRDQMVLECRTCMQRFAVPAESRQEFANQLMTEEELLARLRRLGAALGPTTGPNKRTYYQVLQVDPAADPEVIDAAFRRLARKYHPDTSTEPDAAARMRDILEAKDELSDPERRLRYDRSIGIARRPSGLRPEDI
ncbi:MAG: DnaJ domain-containing protein [Thermomicrobiales bacterium]